MYFPSFLEGKETESALLTLQNTHTCRSSVRKHTRSTFHSYLLSLIQRCGPRNQSKDASGSFRTLVETVAEFRLCHR